MKFIHYLTRISDIDIYGMTSLGIFMLFFLVMLIWVFKSRASSYEAVSRIPLDSSLSNQDNER